MDSSLISQVRIWTAAKAPVQYRHLLPALADTDSVTYVPACLPEMHDVLTRDPALTGRHSLIDGSVLYSSRQGSPDVEQEAPLWQKRGCGEVGLSSREVHVWRAALNVDDIARERLLGVLSPVELERAKRFRFEEDRNRFIVARGLLRHILAGYLHRSPHELGITSEEHVKPALEHAPPGGPLRFNLSHSGDVAVYAVSQDYEVGVDVETIRDGVVDPELIDRVFSPREARRWRSLSQPLQQQSFYLAWTRKEAYAKATGQGLGLNLQEVEVEFRPGREARLIGKSRKKQSERWSVFSLDPAPGYTGALVVDAGPMELRLLEVQTLFECKPDRFEASAR